MFKVAIGKTPILHGTFEDFSLEEMLDSVCRPHLTAVLRFAPCAIELLVERGKLVSARGGIKLSQVLLEEGILSQDGLRAAQRLAPTLLEALPYLNVSEDKIRHATHTQVVLNVNTLIKSNPKHFEVFSARFEPSALKVGSSVQSILLEAMALQEVEKAAFELELVF